MYTQKLPPGYEQALLANFERQMQTLDEAYGRVDQIAKEYSNRLRLIDQGLKNQIPSSRMQQELAKSSARIAQGLGASAEELVKGGFLTQGDADELARLRALDDTSATELAAADPTIRRERDQLMQQLRRSGASASVIDQALRDFDVKSAETIKAGKVGRGIELLNTGAALRQQGYNQATGALGSVQSELERIRGVWGDRANIANARYQANTAAEATKVGLGSEEMSRYERLGKFKFGSDAKKGPLAGKGGKLAAAAINPLVAPTVFKPVKKIFGGLF